MEQKSGAILRYLARQKEDELRRILRPQAEAAFGYDPCFRDELDTARRALLDRALNELMEMELQAELRLPNLSILDPEIVSALDQLSGSASFLRYLDTYLYFGVRLYLGRWKAARQVAGGWTIGDLQDSTEECNRTPIELMPPPVLKTIELPKAAWAWNEFLTATRSDAASDGLAFLDGFHPVESADEAEKYELWLKGLWHDAPAAGGGPGTFARLTQSLEAWVRGRVQFYRSLEGGNGRLDAAWVARNPLTARFGIVDLYWTARLLRMEVSPVGRVGGQAKSWLELIAEYENSIGKKSGCEEMRRALYLLRGVFDFACDLLQNAVELSEADEMLRREPDSCPPLRAPGVKWRTVFDEELEEINYQKYLRTFAREAGKFRHDHWTADELRWSRRIRTGEYPAHETIGLAFSGGGIRSATFGLGVLQGLQELDLLKYVDYLSTVSGGGYIGSWLVGNVKRTSHWLGRKTNWETSIAHLRKYVKYLSPQTGILSADTWTMVGVWIRNTVLVQLTALAWLLLILSGALCLKRVFDNVNDTGLWTMHTWWGTHEVTGQMLAHVVTPLIVLCVGVGVYRNLGPRWERSSLSEVKVQRWVAIPALVSSFFSAALLWAGATQPFSGKDFAGLTRYSQILEMGYWAWWSMFTAMFGGFVFLARKMLDRARMEGWKFVVQCLLWPAVTCGVLYLETAAVMLLFRHWAIEPVSGGWYAFVFGPALVLLSATLAVILFIGLCGPQSNDQLREWWTRLGAWLTMYSALYLIFAVSATLGPLWILMLFHLHVSLAWGTLAGYVGTIISGLMAGQSSKTSGVKSSSLEYLARAGAILFIVGGLLGTATLLHAFLVNKFTDYTLSPMTYWASISGITIWERLAVTGILAVIALLLSWRVELNVFGLNYFYRNRLIRCYLGATRWCPGMRTPNKFTGFDDGDDLALAEMKHGGDRLCDVEYRGPFPIVNCTLNLGGSEDLSVVTRKSASFQLTPLHCGADRCAVGYARTADYSGGVKLGQAMAVSGAAASPNMGYNSSTLVSFMLTMFNVRLGWWFPNPSGKKWSSERLPFFGFYYLLKELFGYADESTDFLNVSDGGHFENLGIYELIRRRTKVIVAADGECDEVMQFGSLGKLLRICETDFGARIELDLTAIRKQENGMSRSHCTAGKITYDNGSVGWLIYLKSSITGDEDVGIAQYRAEHPTFPHESTADQFFIEDQFEAYRRLGRHIAQHAFRGANPEMGIASLAERLADVWSPAGFTSDSFLSHAKALDAIWERFRSTPSLHRLLLELTMDRPQPYGTGPTAEELCACLELVQLMENVFIGLRLDDFWEHPDNRGWALMFTSWAKSPTFRKAWIELRRMFGIRFVYFCQERLGLERDAPVARV